MTSSKELSYYETYFRKKLLGSSQKELSAAPAWFLKKHHKAGVVGKTGAVFCASPLPQFRNSYGQYSVILLPYSFIEQPFSIRECLDIKQVEAELTKGLWFPNPIYVAIPYKMIKSTYHVDLTSKNYIWACYASKSIDRVFGFNVKFDIDKDFSEFVHNPALALLQKKKHQHLENQACKLGHASGENYINFLAKEKYDQQMAIHRQKTVERLFDLTHELRIYEDNKIQFENAAGELTLSNAVLKCYASAVRSVKILNAVLKRELKINQSKKR